jgi:hypothetical protein
VAAVVHAIIDPVMSIRRRRRRTGTAGNAAGGVLRRASSDAMLCAREVLGNSEAGEEAREEVGRELHRVGGGGS